MFIAALFIIARSWKEPRCPSTEKWYIYTMEYYTATKNNEFMKVLRRMDGSRKYHPEWGNPITKEVTWYALTDKWILPRKLEYPRYNLQNTRKSRRRKTNVWIFHSSLEWGIKYPWKELQRQSLELRQKGWTIQRLPNLGIHPIISHQMQTL